MEVVEIVGKRFATVIQDVMDDDDDDDDDEVVIDVEFEDDDDDDDDDNDVDEVVEEDEEEEEEEVDEDGDDNDIVNSSGVVLIKSVLITRPMSFRIALTGTVQCSRRPSTWRRDGDGDRDDPPPGDDESLEDTLLVAVLFNDCNCPLMVGFLPSRRQGSFSLFAVKI